MKAERFSLGTATALVVANMVGTGVFTTLGFQLVEIRSGFVILVLWLVGGVTALCGALSYAELGASLPRSGGEYNFLSEIYHPAAGFVAGWISATIGFAAPIALAAITFGTYCASVFTGLSATWLAVGLVVVLTAAHATSHRTSGGTQRAFTILKVLLIALFCPLAWMLAKVPPDVRFAPASEDAPLLASGAFAVALIYVNYAYSGWNAAAYITGELESPQRTLSRALLIGTALVLVLYLMLNFTFLYVAPVDALVGRIDVGYVAARHVFGSAGGAIMGLALALLLVSTVSAMILAGPRVLQVMGEDYPVLRVLATTNVHDVPHVAVVLQSALALVLIVTASFEAILVFAGFTLGLSTLATVAGVLVLRRRRPALARPYRIPAFPLPPLVYLAVTGWTLVYILVQRPVEGVAGLAIIVGGAVGYLVVARLSRAR